MRGTRGAGLTLHAGLTAWPVCTGAPCDRPGYFGLSSGPLLRDLRKPRDSASAAEE